MRRLVRLISMGLYRTKYRVSVWACEEGAGRSRGRPPSFWVGLWAGVRCGELLGASVVPVAVLLFTQEEQPKTVASNPEYPLWSNVV